MNSQNNLETSGNLSTNSLAELLAEIAQIRLNGSLRLTRETEKIAVYFDAGEPVFAVSNARQHRLYEMLLQKGRITKDQLITIPEFTNDLALKEYLLRFEPFEKQELDALFVKQIAEILKTALHWRNGEWTFSPLVRIKGDVRFAVELRNDLLDHARNLPTAEIERKFADVRESFSVKSARLDGIALSPRESFVFSRFETDALTIEEIQAISGLPGAETRGIIYALWLGGLLFRKNWNAAFSEKKIAAILAARLSLKKEERPPTLQTVVVQPKARSSADSSDKSKNDASANGQTTGASAPVEEQISLDDYLARVEKAATFYEVFALASDAKAAEIKQKYFYLAKRFHPDLFHREADADLFRRIQTAFTKLAQAYDTLKDSDSRELYDFKVRKELAEMKAAEREEMTHEEIDERKQKRFAAENFENGFSLLMDGDGIAAIPFLARAAHFDGGNARYHAYYGKALSADDQQRHKAESELQTAVKLDSQNTDYRLLLAEFFISFNLLKRAEGELQRLLAIAPANREAKRLLDSLPKK